MRLESRGVKLALPSSAVTRSLLAYLILHRGQSISRSRLVGVFWPERPESRARRALSNALWHLRRTLDPAADWLVVEQEQIAFRLAADDWLDVEAFRALCDDRRQTSPQEEIDRLQQAVDLYQADLLEGTYDDWVLLEREQQRERFLIVLDRLTTLFKQVGDYDEALGSAQRLVAADPLRESAHRELMRLYHLLGRPEAALEQFLVLSEVLAQEMGLTPSPATVALYHEIATGTEQFAPPYLPVTSLLASPLYDLARLPFVGRTWERSQLVSALQAAARGHGGLFLVEGDAGVGKTRLVEEAVSNAEWRGFQVGFGKADLLAALTPYQLLQDSLSSLLTPLRIAQLAELVEPMWLSAAAVLFPVISKQVPDLPPLPPGNPHKERQRLWEGLAHLVAGLAIVAPLLWVLEDLHWADEASLSVLPYLVSRFAVGRVLLVLTCRIAEARERAAVEEALDELGRLHPLQQLRLAPFEPLETEALIQRALGGGEGDIAVARFAGRLQAEAGGNALFLVEMLKSLVEQGALEALPGGEWALPQNDRPLPAPTSVQDLVQERIARFDPGLRDVLEQVAVLGDDASFPVLSRASNLFPADLTDRTQALCRRGFLAETGSGYRFEHDVVRDVVYQATTPQRRQRLHCRAAEALEVLCPERVASLAHHFGQGGMRRKALIYTLQSGEQVLAVYDYEAALAHFRRALSLASDDPATRWDILCQQEEILYTLTRWEEGSQVLAEMLALTEAIDDPLRRVRTLLMAGRHEQESASSHQALDMLKEALGLARRTEDEELVGQVLIEISYIHWRQGDTARCESAVTEALDIFQRIGSQEGEGRALKALVSLHVGLTGDYSQALACSEESRRIALGLGNKLGAAIDWGNSALCLARLGDYEAGLERLREALSFITRVGDRYVEGAFYSFQAVCYQGLGDLDRAEQSALRGLDVCREVGNPNFEIDALSKLGLIALDQGNLGQARTWFEQAIQVCEAYDQRSDRAANLSHLALVVSRLGDHELALQLSAEALDVMGHDVAPSDQLKRMVFERAQIVGAAHGTEAARPEIDRAHQLLMVVADRISDADLRRSFLENVSENRAITYAYRLGRVPDPPRRETIRLPRADAPTGRPLRDDEWVEVVWTVSAPEEEELVDAPAKRRYRLLRLLSEAADQGAAPTLAALALGLDVSERTIERDLSALRAAGHQALTRGSRS